MKIEEMALRPVVVLPPDATLADTAEAMADQGVGSVVVVDDRDRIVGIVTDRDVVVHGIARGVPLDGRIDAIMSLDVVSVDGSTDVRDVVRLFGRHSFRRLPVTSHGRVAGMVSLDDLIVAFAEEFAEITRGVAGQLMFPRAGEPAGPPARAAATTR
jgi:signal-transduction protein with cAMP-binding, CBS, and nucleotidyltransferase domain